MYRSPLGQSLVSAWGGTWSLGNAVRSTADAAANGIQYPFPGFEGTVASALRQYPQVRANDTVALYGTPLGFSRYHSLQIIVNRQFTRGLTVYANYVWSETLTNVSSSDPTGNSSPLDYYNLALEKTLRCSDRPHDFKAYVDYELPIGRGKTLWLSAGPVANAIFGGWSVSGILNYSSGSALGFGALSPLPGAWNGAGSRANIAPGDMKVKFDKSKFDFANRMSPNNAYLNKSPLSEPAPLTLGTSVPGMQSVAASGSIDEYHQLTVRASAPRSRESDYSLQHAPRFLIRLWAQLAGERVHICPLSRISLLQSSVKEKHLCL